jgi:hypothetical protein
MSLSKIIKDIVLIANGRDARGDHEVAEHLDKMASDLSMIKQAQYAGVQGTAVRNGRCWQGCFRHKRAEGLQPSEAWTRCHEEYVEAIGGSAREWGKYASSDGSQSTWEPEPFGGSESLADVISTKLASGDAPEVAIPESVAEHLMAIPDRLVRCANQMGVIASGLDEDDLAASGRLRVAASALRDEAWEMTKQSLPNEV